MWDVHCPGKFQIPPREKVLLRLQTPLSKWDQTNSDIWYNQVSLLTYRRCHLSPRYRGGKRGGASWLSLDLILHLHEYVSSRSQKGNQQCINDTNRNHTFRLIGSLHFFGLLTISQISISQMVMLFSQRWEMETLSLCLQSLPSQYTPFHQLETNILMKQSPKNRCHINAPAPEAWHNSVKTEVNKVLCGYAADYDPQLKEYRENTVFASFFLLILFFQWGA